MDRARLVPLAVTVALLLVLLVSGGAPAAAAAAAAPRTPPRSACQQLAASAKDRARSAKLVLVARGDDETGLIRACVLPRGKVRTLASLVYRPGRDWARVVATAGAWVLVEEVRNDLSGGRSRSLTRHDVRSGRRFSLSHYGCRRAVNGPIRCPDGTDFGHVGLAASGAGAIERIDLATGIPTLWAFGRDEVFVSLVEGAVEALRVTGSQVSWTQRGVTRTMSLPVG